jgi:phosphoenolpyruvate carboxykinase (ATP)
MLGAKMNSNKANVWLINTGWTGGPNGVGSRMRLKYTRSMISAALEGKLAKATYETLPIFGLQIPTSCPDVPTELLNPRNTWADKASYDTYAAKLADLFVNNFQKYASEASEEILAAAPVIAK